MDTFLALADPNRRRIVELLSVGAKSAGDLAAQFDISSPAVSQHLKTLREARLVHVEVRAQQRIYSLSSEGFSEIDNWLERYARFWSTRLDKLQSIMTNAAHGLDATVVDKPTNSATSSPRIPKSKPISKGRKRS